MALGAYGFRLADYQASSFGVAGTGTTLATRTSYSSTIVARSIVMQGAVNQAYTPSWRPVIFTDTGTLVAMGAAQSPYWDGSSTSFVEITFDSPVTLAGNTWYWIGVCTTSGNLIFGPAIHTASVPAGFTQEQTEMRYGYEGPGAMPTNGYGDNTTGYELRFDLPNAAPTQPGAFTLPTSGTIYNDTIALAWGASSDPEGNAITYELQYSASGVGGTYAALASGLTSPNYTWTIPGQNTVAAFRVRAVDSAGAASAWRESPQCAINRSPGLAGAFTSPLAGQVHDASFTASWGAGSDPDGAQTLYYGLEYSLNGGSTWIALLTAGNYHSSLSFAVNSAGWAESTNVKMRVRTIDSLSQPSTQWRESGTFTISHNTAPTAPGAWTSPTLSEMVIGSDLVEVTAATDAQGNTLTYDFDLLDNGVVVDTYQVKGASRSFNYDYSTRANTTQATWRARAWDGLVYGPYSTSPVFTIYNSKVRVKKDGAFQAVKKNVRSKAGGLFS